MTQAWVLLGILVFVAYQTIVLEDRCRMLEERMQLIEYESRFTEMPRPAVSADSSTTMEP
jgi:hypothetical protein